MRGFVESSRTSFAKSRRFDARKDLGVDVAPGEGTESLRAQCVQAERDAVQARGAQFRSLLGEQDAVGGHREVADARILGQQPHQLR